MIENSYFIGETGPRKTENDFKNVQKCAELTWEIFQYLHFIKKQENYNDKRSLSNGRNIAYYTMFPHAACFFPF